MQPQVNIEACCTLCSSRGEASVPRPMLSISELLGQVSCDTDSKQTVRQTRASRVNTAVSTTFLKTRKVLFWGRSYWHTDFRLTYVVFNLSTADIYTANQLYSHLSVTKHTVNCLNNVWTDRSANSKQFLNHFQETSWKELFCSLAPFKVKIDFFFRVSCCVLFLSSTFNIK